MQYRFSPIMRSGGSARWLSSQRRSAMSHNAAYWRNRLSQQALVIWSSTSGMPDWPSTYRWILQFSCRAARCHPNPAVRASHIQLSECWHDFAAVEGFVANVCVHPANLAPISQRLRRLRNQPTSGPAVYRGACVALTRQRAKLLDAMGLLQQRAEPRSCSCASRQSG